MAAGSFDKSSETLAQARAQTRQAMTAGGLRAIDIHAHYFGPKYLDLMNADGKRANPADPSITDVKLRIAAMDEQGVSVHALSLTAPLVYWGDENRSHQIAAAGNDEAAAAHKQYADRLVVFATLPMQFPGAAERGV
jgi:aminocarboxymuconate-semialdehyde decarboxylase